MLYIIASWAILFALTASIGNLCRLAFVRTVKACADPIDIFTLFWLGMAALVAFIQLLSLFLPIDGRILALYIIIGIAGIPSLIAHLRNIEKPRRAVLSMSAFLLLALLVAVIGSFGVGTPDWSYAYDTDLYHFSSVRWINTYPAVPGLGNLHARLAFTSGFLLFSALVDNMWWDLQSAWITMSLFIAIATLQWIHVALGRGNDSTRTRLFCLISLPYLLRLLAASSPQLYYDKPALIVQAVFLLSSLRLIEQWKPNRQSPLLIFFMVSTAALAFSFKTSGAFVLLVGFGTMLFAMIFWIRKEPRTRSLRLCVGVATLPGLLIFGQLARNVILAGWLLFPAPLGNIHAEWSMPAKATGITPAEEVQSVEAHYLGIQAWARAPGPAHRLVVDKSFAFNSWLPAWVEQTRKKPEWPLFWIGICSVAGYFAWLIAKRNWQSALREAFPAVLVTGNLAFWFFSAPSLRFGDWLCWALAAYGISTVTAACLSKYMQAMGVGCMIFILLFGESDIRMENPDNISMLSVGRAKPLYTDAQRIDNGQEPPLIVLVPFPGDDRCGDASLPSTPYPRKELMLRRPGSLRNGFRIKSQEL